MSCIRFTSSERINMCIMSLIYLSTENELFAHTNTFKQLQHFLYHHYVINLKIGLYTLKMKTGSPVYFYLILFYFYWLNRVTRCYNCFDNFRIKLSFFILYCTIKQCSNFLEKYAIIIAFCLDSILQSQAERCPGLRWVSMIAESQQF